MPVVVTSHVRLVPPFDRVRVPDVSISDRGVTLLDGRNGSGKSAFVELCAGTARVSSGDVRVLGLDPADPRLRRRRGVCRTSVALASDASVRQHARLFSRHSGEPETTYLDRLAAYGGTGWLDVPTRMLSTGSARLAWVVLTTTPRRRLMILDEPFLGLDDAAASILQREIASWADDAAVVLVDHGSHRRWATGAHRILIEAVP